MKHKTSIAQTLLHNIMQNESDNAINFYNGSFNVVPHFV